MTDDKVKEAVERVRVVARQGDPCGPWADDLNAVLSSHDALQAERDKLSAEVERLTAESHRRGISIIRMSEYAGAHLCRAEAAEAKLTALVELLKTAQDLIMEAAQTGSFSTGKYERIRQALAHHSAPVAEAAPIPMLLFCPNCGVQHVDAPEFVPDPGGGDLGVAMRVAAMRATAWANPPHRSHLCGSCGCIWRPADVPTEGVKAIETKGTADNWTAPPTTPTSAPVEDVGGLREKVVHLILTHVYAEHRADDLFGLDEAADAILAALSPSLIQPQGEERSTDAPENFGPLVDAWNTRSKPPQGDVGADSGLAAADDNHKALVEALMNSAVGLEYMAANRGGKLAREFKDQAAKNRALIAAFQSRQEEK